MQTALPETATTCVVLVAVAYHVATRRERSTLHWILLALIASMLAWTGGLSAFYYFESGQWARLGLAIGFLGVFTVPPCWLLLAAHHTHLRFFDERPGWLLAILIPSAMNVLAVVTNSGHHLFASEFALRTMQMPPNRWAGPFFWEGVGFGILLTVIGSALYLGAAARLYLNGQRRRGVALAGVVSMPIVLGPIVGVWLSRDVTPTLLGLSTVLLFSMDWRHRLLETLPIARRDVIEHLPDGVILTDNAGFALDANLTAEGLLGASVADIRRHSLSLLMADLAGEGERARLKSLIDSLILAGSPLSTDFLDRYGRVLELKAARVLSGGGECAGFYVLLRDRTEHRRYEKFLQQNQRLETIASLSAGIAHEVNTPLAFVRSNLNHIQRVAALLAEDLAAPCGEKREDLQELMQAADESLEGVERIGRTIDRMRRFSRLQDLEMSPIDVNFVVNDTLKMARLRNGPEVAVVTDLAPSLPEVWGSAEHLVQALLNIVINARQALRDRGDGRLRVSTRRRHDQVEIRIEDNGPGIPDELQDRIFDPFYTTKGAGEGSGLGLAIAFGIVREHGGVIDLESTPSRGSEFIVRLPVAS